MQKKKTPKLELDEREGTEWQISDRYPCAHILVADFRNSGKCAIEKGYKKNLQTL